MQFLYKIQPVRPELLKDGPSQHEERIISEHFSYLKRLMQDGVLILASRTLNVDASSFGIVIFDAQSEEMAIRILREDPAVQNNVFRGELFPYRVALINENNARTTSA